MAKIEPKFRIENGNLIFENNFKFKKISGHSFVDILGLNPWTTLGDALISHFGIVSTPIDPKYTIRGDFAESIVQTVYKRDGHNITTYDKYEYHFDNFQDNEYFGGLIDIELLDEKTLIEVKSKSLSKYDEIEKKQPKEEVYQGLLYGYLRGYEKITMEWIFFDEQSESEIFAGQTPTSLKNMKRFSKTFEVNRNEIHSLMGKAYNAVNQFVETKTITLDLVSEKMQRKLGILGKPVDVNDLPF